MSEDVEILSETSWRKCSSCRANGRQAQATICLQTAASSIYLRRQLRRILVAVQLVGYQPHAAVADALIRIRRCTQSHFC